MTDPTIPEPVASFIEAVNRHDAAAFLDAFTATGSVDDWGRIFTGREQIEAWSDREFIGSDGILTVEDVATDGGATIVTGDWRSTHANGRSRFSFQTDGDRIERMTIREG